MKQTANQKVKSGYDRWKRNVLRRCLNIASDGADVTCDGRLFQKLAPETEKARLPTVERLNSGTASWLEEAEICQLFSICSHPQPVCFDFLWLCCWSWGY